MACFWNSSRSVLPASKVCANLTCLICFSALINAKVAPPTAAMIPPQIPPFFPPTINPAIAPCTPADNPPPAAACADLPSKSPAAIAFLAESAK